MFGLTVKNAQANFFDRSTVMRSMGAARRRALSKAGAFIRQTAKGSIRTRKKYSEPGQPPTNRTGLLKRFIFFSYDPTAESVVVGPALLARMKGNAPSLLEYGGTTTVTSDGRKLPTHYEPRPFMGPALEKNEDKIAGFWADSIK